MRRLHILIPVLVMLGGAVSCSTTDVYFRGECNQISHTFLGYMVYREIDCSLPSGSEVAELTGDEKGEIDHESRFMRFLRLWRIYTRTVESADSTGDG